MTHDELSPRSPRIKVFRDELLIGFKGRSLGLHNRKLTPNEYYSQMREKDIDEMDGQHPQIQDKIEASASDLKF